jgi:hypothetical protein
MCPMSSIWLSCRPTANSLTAMGGPPTLERRSRLEAGVTVKTLHHDWQCLVPGSYDISKMAQNYLSLHESCPRQTTLLQ